MSDLPDKNLLDADDDQDDDDDEEYTGDAELDSPYDFWAATISAGSPTVVNPPHDSTLRLSVVTLGDAPLSSNPSFLNVEVDEEQRAVICVLSKEHPTQSLELLFPGDSRAVFSVTGHPANVYLSGFLQLHGLEGPFLSDQDLSELEGEENVGEEEEGPEPLPPPQPKANGQIIGQKRKIPVSALAEQKEPPMIQQPKQVKLQQPTQVKPKQPKQPKHATFASPAAAAGSPPGPGLPSGQPKPKKQKLQQAANAPPGLAPALAGDPLTPPGPKKQKVAPSSAGHTPARPGVLQAAGKPPKPKGTKKPKIQAPVSP